jgi:transposase-like protein
MPRSHYGPEEKAKLDRLIKEGSTVLQEVEDLQAGLKDTVKAVAEELEIKPSVINKAIKIAHKGDWKAHEEEWEEIESILGITNNIPSDNSTGGE